MTFGISRREFVLGAMAVSVASPSAGAGAADREIVTRDDLVHHFLGLNTDGSMAVLDLESGSFHCVNVERTGQGFLPASTFKIPNALIALDCGAVKSPDEKFEWDGVQRMVADWNRDHTLAGAFRVSAVWVFQEVARRIGPERMTSYLRRLDYGNRNIGGGIDQFWLSGDLRISALEQIDFLERLLRSELPVSKEAQSAVREIMLVEETPAYAIRAKTGWANFEGGDGLGWWVGWVEPKKGNPAIFALNMDIRQNDHAKARIPVAKAILGELGLIPSV